MRTILIGNAGSGKSTLARQLAARQSAARLSLDEVAFAGGVERRPLQDSIADVRRFIDAYANWIIEGCYADILAAVLDEGNELIFLNPGVEACIAHCRARPWEPEKFGTQQAQDETLNNLIAWIRDYDEREDEYGLRSHRALFEAFRGKKREFTDPRQYEFWQGW